MAKENHSTTPKSESNSARKKEHEAHDEGKKKSKFMSNNKVMKFVNDVKDGENKEFDLTTLNGFFKELLFRIKTVDVTGLGSQLAFFFLLSLFPLLIFTFTLLPYFNLDQSQVIVFIKEFAPGSVGSLIEDTLGEILNNRNTGLLSVGALATVWSASKGMNALTKALNLSYHQEETRSFVVARGMSVVFTVMLILVVVVALLLPVFGQQIGVIIFSYLGLEEGFLFWWNSIRLAIPPLIIFIVFTLVYWLVPNVKLPFKSVLPGAAFASLGWIITSLGFSFYVSNFGSYSSTYGSIGAIIVLMMWLYLSGIILMLGGQINAVMGERKEAVLEKKGKLA